MSRFDAIVIGAGANGLEAAAALGRAGRRVLIVERAETLGGQGCSWEFAPGFRAAPLGLDPGWLPPRVARALGITGLDLVAPETAVSVATESGRFLSLPRDPGRAAVAIRPWSARDAAEWPAFVSRLRRRCEFLEALYQRPAPDLAATGFGELAGLAGLGWKLRRLGRPDMTAFLRTVPMAIAEQLDDAFEAEPLKAAIAAGAVRHLRQGPRSGGTAFVLLHHLVGAPPGSVRSRGWWRDGPDAPTVALETAARRHGVAIRPGARVARILVRDDRVAGIALASGEEIAAAVVLSSADPARTLLELVDPVWLDPEFLHAVRQIKFRGATGYVVHALDGLPEFRGLDQPTDALASVVSLTPTMDALERAADAAKYGSIAERPHVEISVPTLRWPELAPPAKHVLVAEVQWMPHRLREGNGAEPERERIEGAVARALDTVAPGWGDRLLHRVSLTPRDLERRFGLTEGAVTHGELMLDQILFMRPIPGWSRYAMPIAGLYLCGAGAHPGPGILGGPGWLAARKALSPPITRLRE